MLIIQNGQKGHGYWHCIYNPLSKVSIHLACSRLSPAAASSSCRACTGPEALPTVDHHPLSFQSGVLFLEADLELREPRQIDAPPSAYSKQQVTNKQPLFGDQDNMPRTNVEASSVRTREYGDGLCVDSSESEYQAAVPGRYNYESWQRNIPVGLRT